MKKGITFIQMISIIMIIGVIAVIALPEITNPLVIQQKSSFKNDVLQLIETIERQEIVTNNNFDRTILTVENLKQELNVDTVNYKYLEVTEEEIIVIGKLKYNNLKATGTKNNLIITNE